MGFTKTYDHFSKELSQVLAKHSDKKLHELTSEFENHGLVNVQDLLPKLMWDQLFAETNEIINERPLHNSVIPCAL